MRDGKAVGRVSAKDLGRLIHHLGRSPHMRHLEAHVVHVGRIESVFTEAGHSRGCRRDARSGCVVCCKGERMPRRAGCARVIVGELIGSGYGAALCAMGLRGCLEDRRQRWEEDLGGVSRMK